jgi:DNA-binding Lrp family transcriptional regulator
MFYYRDTRDLENIIERIGLIKHVSAVETDIPRSHHSADATLSPLDWKIIYSLNHDARKKNHEIAKELEVSPKTIKRRLNRLLKDRIIYFTVDVDLSKAKNYIIYVLAVELETGVRKETIYAQMKNRFDDIWATAGPVRSSIVFFMYAKMLSEIGKVVEEVKRIPGVKMANAFLYTSCYRFTEWYDKKIEEMAKW